MPKIKPYIQPIKTLQKCAGCEFMIVHRSNRMYCPSCADKRRRERDYQRQRSAILEKRGIVLG